MKKLLLLLAILAVSCQKASSDDRPITPEELPQAARVFIDLHFAAAQMLLASVDKDFTDTHYDVVLADGISLEFDRKGEWTDVDCGRGRVPEAIVPEAIRTQLAAHYSTHFVREISRNRRGYELSLSNGLELKYDNSFRLVEVDD